MVSYSSYFNTLRTDVAGGSADDIFWVSNAYLAGYADSGRLMDIGKTLGPEATSSVGAVGGRAVHPRRDAVGCAATDRRRHRDVLQRRSARRRRRRRRRIDGLRWSPDGGDTLRPLLARLTVDADGRTAATAGFDAGRVRQWAYNAANDAQGIYLNYIGSAGGVVPGRRSVRVRQPRRDRGLQLPGRADQRRPRRATRLGHQRQRRLLPQPIPGRQDGALPVRHLQPGVGGRRRPASGGAWRCCPQARRGGSASPTALPRPAIRRPCTRMRCVRCWPGWAAPRATHIWAASGSAIPAVLSAQRVYFDYWAEQGRRRHTVLLRPRTGRASPAPGGAGFAAGNRHCKAISTRCSWAEAMSRRPCAGPRTRPTPPRAASTSRRLAPQGDFECDRRDAHRDSDRERQPVS